LLPEDISTLNNLDMKTKTKWLAASCGISVLLLIFACNKDMGPSNGSGTNQVPNGKEKVSVILMDGPVQFDSVLIDIRQVAVEVDTAQNQMAPDNPIFFGFDFFGFGRNRNNPSLIWDTLSITPGIYDLLQLRNGVDTLLATGVVTAGKILKVRVTLGSDNTVYTDSVTSYPLVIFGPNPYFDINVRRDDVDSVTNNEFKLWLDFNLHRSIFFWDGQFLLNPEITVFNDQMLGRVEGFINPSGSAALVELYNQTDTIYAVPGWQGNYLVRGVNAGVYSLAVTGRHGYNDTTINNISVSNGQTTDVPKITLHQ
jgi:hypothetical protein